MYYSIHRRSNNSYKRREPSGSPAVDLPDLHQELQAADRGQADRGPVRARRRGQDQTPRHQVPARLQRAEWSRESHTIFIFLFYAGVENY